MIARIRVLVGVAGCALVASPLHASVIHASRVEHFAQGLQGGGGAVLAERSNPAQALGAPEFGDVMNFVSLGFGGAIVLGFDQPFTDSVQIIETTYSDPAMHPEACNVFVGVGASWDTATYYSIGVRRNTEDDQLMSLSIANVASGTSAYNFLKIVDFSDRNLLPPDADGYDIDGISVIASAPAPAGGMLGLLSVLGAGARRTRRRGT